LLQSQHERGVTGLSVGIVCADTGRKHTDAADVLALLRACGERPGGRYAAEQRDELAAIARQILPAAA
jgi:hypothetical protein